MVALENLEISRVFLYTVSAQALFEAVAQSLKVLNFRGCHLRLSATAVAHMIRHNHSLTDLDLSHNPYLFGFPLTRKTRDRTLNMLVQKGLAFNLTLRQLVLLPIPDGPVKRQLDISRFRQNFVKENRSVLDIPPAVRPHLLARVSAKPSALHLFLRENVVALFP